MKIVQFVKFILSVSSGNLDLRYFFNITPQIHIHVTTDVDDDDRESTMHVIRHSFKDIEN